MELGSHTSGDRAEGTAPGIIRRSLFAGKQRPDETGNVMGRDFPAFSPGFGFSRADDGKSPGGR